MKNYRAIEIVLKVTGNRPPPPENDFGRLAAVSHRVMKASHPNAKPPQAAGARGAFKTVTVPQPSDRVTSVAKEFALARIPVPEQTVGRERVRVFETIAGEALGVMAAYGHQRMTIFYSTKPKRGADPVVYLYMPLAKGKSLLDSLGVVRANAPLAAKLFLDTCNQVKALHRAGFYHGDLKPANVMVETAHGGSAHLIDFGLLRRPWRATDWGTADYAAYSKDFHSRLKSALPSTTADAATRGEIQLIVGKLEQPFVDFLKRVRDEAQARGGAAGLNDLDARTPYNSALTAVQLDNASLFMIAVELGLLVPQTQAAFLECARYAFDPARFKALKAAIRQHFGVRGAKDHALRPIASAEDIVIQVKDSNTLNPEVVANELEPRIRAKLDDQAVARGAAEAAEVHADAFKLHKALAGVTEAYAAAGARNVDAKVQILTKLIDLLSWSPTRAAINEVLSKLFFVALVNRKGGWGYRKHTTSFKALHARLMREDLRPAATRWLGALDTNESRSFDAVYAKVLLAVRGLCPRIDEQLTARGSSKLKAELRDEVFMTIVEQSVPVAPGPRTQAAAATALAAGVLRVKENFDLRFGGIASAAANAAAATQTVDVTDVDCAPVVAALQSEFRKLYGGARAQDIAAFVDELNGAIQSPFMPATDWKVARQSVGARSFESYVSNSPKGKAGGFLGAAAYEDPNDDLYPDNDDDDDDYQIPDASAFRNAMNQGFE